MNTERRTRSASSLAGKRVHLTVGHGGNYKDYVANVSEICDMVQIRKRAAG